MKKLEDYVNVLALILGSATGCNWSVLNPPSISPSVGPNSSPEIYCYNLSETENLLSVNMMLTEMVMPKGLKRESLTVITIFQKG
ncbi:MAG: hypothetical protein AABY40_00790 [Nanoarchaeota archaeon]